MTWKSGDWVEVRSKAEILATLDKDGRLEGMPLMPQMLQYCGKRFKVHKRAHKICDPTRHLNSCQVEDTVCLDLRCDGKAHDGCQAACLLFWRAAWLKPVQDGVGAPPQQSASSSGCSEEDVVAATRRIGTDGKVERYYCQATEVPHFSRKLRWWNLGQYVEDYTSGNTSLWRLVSGLAYVCVGWPFARRFSICRQIYDWLQARLGGVPFPRLNGKLALGAVMPFSSLDLQPGELVRVKSYEQILATCDVHNQNRGMFFDAEMVPYCGRLFRVRTRVERFIDEKLGVPRTLKTPAVILEGVWCQSRYSECRMHCPRQIYSWWREVWLERAEESSGNAVGISEKVPAQRAC